MVPHVLTPSEGGHLDVKSPYKTCNFKLQPVSLLLPHGKYKQVIPPFSKLFLSLLMMHVSEPALQKDGAM